MWADVDPSTFEPVIEEELEKYNCYRDEVIDLENFMTDLLDKVKVSKQSCPSWKNSADWTFRIRMRGSLLLERMINLSKLENGCYRSWMSLIRLTRSF
jgi:hypothetical protein